MRRTTPLLAALLGLAAHHAASADIITVPGDYPTIQAGINAAQDGDKVVVSPGTYFENISFVGKDITVRSTDPLDPSIVDATIIDGQFLGRGVLLDRGKISGFTIRNGGGEDGGGIYLQFAQDQDGEISNNVVSGCAAIWGGGIGAHSGGPNAQRVVRDNIVTGNSAWGGAGISAGSVLVENNLICFNETDHFKYAHGGGISAGTAAVIRGNVIIGNYSFDVGGGVNVLTDALIEDNLIADNASSSGGGGVYVDILSYGAVVRNNTIVGNTAEGVSGSDIGGGGIHDEAGIPLIGNTIVGNRVAEAGEGGGVYSLWDSVMIGNLIAANMIEDEDGLGGGVYSYWSSLLVGNTIVANAAGSPDGQGGGIYISGLANNTAMFGNVIANSRAGEGLYVHPDAPYAVADYNCVFGNAGGNYGGAAQPGAHDVDLDPMFIRLPDPGPDGEWGTEDDDYGDLRLQPGSPCIDAADNTAVPADATDLDDDGDTEEPIPFDQNGKLRFIDDPTTADCAQAPGECGECPVVDIGAYEFQQGSADCCPADFDEDGTVGATDLAVLLGSWGSCPPKEDCPADLDGNGHVGAYDLALLLGSWGLCA